MEFALTTQTFRQRPLTGQLLADMAQAGFGGVELYLEAGHFSLDSPESGPRLRDWLSAASLRLVAVHAPAAVRQRDQWHSLPSLAHTDAEKRRIAVMAAEHALELRNHVPFDTLVVHVGVPDLARESAGDNSRDAARRSLEQLANTTVHAGVRLALEVHANPLATTEALVSLIDVDLDFPHVGLCFDFGHAHLTGDVVDAIEAASGHILMTHLHDNRGRSDEHLWPFDGTIDWGAAFMTLQKVGFEGACVMAPRAGSSQPIAELLARAVTARQRLADVLYAM